jgi:trk system potassium uptake protein TrkH
MNYALVTKYLGHFIFLSAPLMLPSVLWAVWFSEWIALKALLESMFIAVAVGILLSVLGRNAPDRMFQREGLALVGLGWLLTAAMGALPYILSGTLSPVDAYFESMSGFTTTGSTVIRDIEAVDKSILFWRAMTHWLGGMGIIVLFIAVLPYLGAGGKQLFKTESPGPDPRGLSPRIKDTASTLYKMYLALTVVQTILLMVAGMGLYDAVCHTFATLATGGFSPKQASIAYYDSVWIEAIIIVFMGLAGTNFALFFAMSHGDRWAMFRSTEWRVYVAILLLATCLITANLLGAQGPSPFEAAEPEPAYTPAHAFRVAAFQVVSVMTTTGFITADFDQWPELSRMILVLLMFVGGCAGSTGGGIKVIRIVMLLKMVYARVESTFRPRTVRALRVNDVVIDDGVQRTVYAFIVLYMFILGAGSLCMAALGLPFQTAVTAVVTTLNNIGPGLEFVGASRDFSLIPDTGKLLLSLFMVLGRLELFAICVLFIPSFWRAA